MAIQKCKEGYCNFVTMGLGLMIIHLESTFHPYAQSLCADTEEKSHKNILSDV